MIIQNIKIQNIRSYEFAELPINKGINAIYGNNGLKKNISLELEIIELNNKLSSFQKVLYDIEKKTSSLSKKNLDLDLLDEQSRKILGLIRPDEIMLIEK